MELLGAAGVARRTSWALPLLPGKPRRASARDQRGEPVRGPELYDASISSVCSRHRLARLSRHEHIQRPLRGHAAPVLATGCWWRPITCGRTKSTTAPTAAAMVTKWIRRIRSARPAIPPAAPGTPAMWSMATRSISSPSAWASPCSTSRELQAPLRATGN